MDLVGNSDSKRNKAGQQRPGMAGGVETEIQKECQDAIKRDVKKAVRIEQ